MEAELFSVGDVVRIREWDDMLKEYGEIGGDINCTCMFVKDMRVSCGAQCTIDSKFDDIVTLKFHDSEIGNKMRGFSFSTDMIEPTTDMSSLAESLSRVSDFLSGM